MNDSERPVIINGIPVYDTDNYVPGQTKSKTTRKNLIKKIINVPQNIINNETEDEIKYQDPIIYEQAIYEKHIDKKYGYSSLICGILSLCLIWSIIFSIPLSVLAIFYSKKATKEEVTDPTETSCAKIGRITGYITLTIIISMIVIGIWELSPYYY